MAMPLFAWRPRICSSEKGGTRSRHEVPGASAGGSSLHRTGPAGRLVGRPAWRLRLLDDAAEHARLLVQRGAHVLAAEHDAFERVCVDLAELAVERAEPH